MFKKYLKTIGLENLVSLIANTKLNNFVAEAFKKKPKELTAEQIQNLYVYDVPKISADGSCSILEEKAEKPYSLVETFGLDADWNDLKNHKQTIRLWRLKQIVEQIFKQTQVEWFGIYRAIHIERAKRNVIPDSCPPVPGFGRRVIGDPENNLDSRLRGNDRKGRGNDKDYISFLVKESYAGVFSRAEFPLTKKFAKKSNNSTVGLSGKAIVIQDVAAHNGAYYKCDGEVNSEFCLPIFGVDNKIIGIIDAEAFAKNHYTEERLLQIAKVAYDLGQINLGL